MISVEIVGREKIIADLNGLQPKLLKQVQDAVKASAYEVQALTMQKLSGDVLNVRTGRLRRSINVKFNTSETGAEATIGTNVEYARVHEYGGLVRIKEHMRMMTQAFGRPVKEPREIPVAAHDVNYPERSFLRSSLKELAPKIIAQIKAAGGAPK